MRVGYLEVSRGAVWHNVNSSAARRTLEPPNDRLRGWRKPARKYTAWG